MANNSNFTINIKALFDASDVKAKVGDIQNSLKSLKLPDKLAADLNTSFANVNKALDDFVSKTEKGIKTKADATGISKSFDTVTKELTKLDNLMIKVKGQLGDGVDLSQIIRIDSKTQTELDNINTKIQDLQKELSSINTNKLSELQQILSQIKSGSGAAKQGEEALKLFNEGDVQGALNTLDKIIAKLQVYQTVNASTGKDLTNVNNSVMQLTQMYIKMSEAQTESADKIAEINNLSAQGAEKLTQAQNNVINSTNNAAEALHQEATAANEVGSNIKDLTSRQEQFVREVDQIKSRIQYFFGLSNAINLVKRAVRGAVDTIKDLDKAMTETAVVTDFTVSDMWKQLPEYTKRANELGVTTQQAYESATLFYQQGLNSQQAAALSTETLKMARIAGLDAADATDRMTNALRGFNMELDATAAQRVDDVYSQLAAHTASNVDEISTAMTKVASLAHSANMEFETTAAFLSQIIETTRESAETAGTALKTVIARFSEVKKLYSEDQLKGTDEEGQIINVNKISAALQTAGIDLNKYFLGEVGLDDIFMELASKWDSLTSVQQRYIATQAAGSRQQSRFIALMQDYARTQELVGLAYDANGASAKQFEKTQESLQSKLARLKNAWNEFLMGLANSTVVKTAVDLLTDLLNIVNKITGAFGEGAGGILKWVAALSTLGAARSAFSAGGIGTRIISGIMGNSPFANKIRTIFGQGQIDENTGQYTAFNKEDIKGQKGTTIFGGIGNLGKSLWGSAQHLGRITAYNTKLGGAFASGLQGLGAIEGLAAGLTGVTTALGAVAAAAATVYGLYQAWLKLTPQGQVKTAERYADALNKVATATKKNANEARTAKEKVAELDKAEQSATTTEERHAAIQSRNEYIQSLLEENEAYAQYLNTTFENGEIVLTLDSDKLAEAANIAAEAAVKAAASASFADANLAIRQANLQQTRINRMGINADGTVNDYNEYGDAITRAMTDAERIEYNKYQLQLESYMSAAKANAQKAFAELIDVDLVTDETANLMSQALAEGFEGTDLPTASGWWRSRTHWQNEYTKLYGTEADTSMQTADIYRAVQMYENTTGQREQTEKLTELITSSQGATINKLLESYLGQGDFKNRSLVGLNVNSDEAIYRWLGVVDESAEGLQQFEQNIIDLADALGVETADVLDRIKKRAKEEKRQQAQNLWNTSRNLAQSGVSTKNIRSFLGMDFEGQQILQSLTESIDTSYLTDTVTASLIDGLNSKDVDFSEWIQQLDLSNPIQAFEELTTKAQKGTGNIQTVAQALLDAGNSSEQFSKSNQLAFLTLSNDYDSLSESLGEFIEENGSISSENIRELAASSKDLNALLKNGTMTAKGLAIALEGIETGKFTTLDFNDALLAAINSADDLDGVVSQLIDDLNNFDAGFDENDITGFIGTVLDNATENIEKGAWGNNVMGNYMRKIFGDFEYTGPKEGYGEAYKKWINKNVAWLKANKDNMFSAWDDFVGKGNEKTLELITDSGKKTAKVLEKNGEIIVEAGTMTTDELVQAMVNNSKLTETQAKMMVGDFKNYSADFAYEMSQNDLPNSVKAWANALGDQGWYLDKDLQVLADALGTDKDKIRDVLKDLGISLTEFEWGEGSTQDILKVIAQAQALGGQVDLLNRPHVKNADGTISTVASETFSNAAGTVWGNFTPILPDGSIMDASSFQTYCEGVLEGVQKDTLNLQIGADFTNLEDAEATAQQIHEIQAALDGLGEYNWDTLKQAFDDAGLSQYFENVANDIIDVGDTFYASFLGNKDLVPIEVQKGQTAGEAYAQAYQKAVNQDLALEIGKWLKDNFPEFTFKIDTETGLAEIKQVQDKLDDLNDTTAKPGVSLQGGSSTALTLSDIIKKLDSINGKHVQASVGINYTGKGSGLMGGASGGLVGSYAAGSENTRLKPGVALTGEEGPEIVWNKDKGYAYITGKNHPEFQDLQPGDRVFNAQETKKILSGAATGGLVPSLARGYEDAPKVDDKKKKSGGSGSSKNDEDNEWKNEIDWLYNLVENIEELERQQTKLQEEYNDLLKDDAKTGHDLYKMLIKQMGNLYAQLDSQTFALEKREQEMREFMDTTNDKDEYLWYNWNDRTIEIDWDKIDKITDEDAYNHIKDLIDQAEEIQDKMDDAEDAIIDINNQIQDLENIWRDTFTDFEDRVLKAIVQSYQQVIDNYSELNDTLNDTNTSILDAINKEISLQRQIRDNTKTEEEIADNEARLAYLRRDTSGGNDLSALQLEKDINDAREQYTDNLVDQAVQRLQEDNDAAAEQREKQIEIMQAQLDYQSENGEFNEYLRELLDNAVSPDGTLATDSDLYRLLTEQENRDAMTDVQRQVWEEELNGTFKEVLAFLLKEQGEAEGTYFTAVTAAFDSLSKTYDKYMIGSYSQGAIHNGSSGSGGSGGGGGSNKGSTGSNKPTAVANGEIVLTLAPETKTATNSVIDPSTKQLKIKAYKYATGGLATQSGPAWLDGTPKEPEYVLNARQTEAFLKLADVLPAAMSNSNSSVSNTFGSNYINFAINVDKIDSDYSVDQMVDRIKDKLFSDASYRNVNTLSFIR